MKKIVALVLALMLALSMLTVATAETANPVAGKKVAYIMLLPSATIFQMWKDSCADLCAALDVDFDFYFCDGDFNRWMDTINTCAAAGYDGLLVSHGNQDGSYVFLKELTEKYPELKLVCFDTQFYTDGEYQKIEGVTQPVSYTHLSPSKPRPEKLEEFLTKMVVVSLRASLLMLCTLVEWIMAECLQPCSARKASSTASSMLLTRTMGSTGMSISVMTKEMCIRDR